MELTQAFILLVMMGAVISRPSVTDEDLRKLITDVYGMDHGGQITQMVVETALKFKSLHEVEAPATPCNPKKCKQPNCHCSGSDIPGGVSVDQVPQMVVLTFQNAITDPFFDRYMSLMTAYKNPNRCPVSGTFFVQHKYTNYYEVQSLYAARQEIADNTVTFPNPDPDRSVADWQKQMQAQKTILSKWANVATNDIQGFRAPNLSPGGDAQIQALANAKLSYDSSRTTTKFIDSPGIMWPYTYDYLSTQDCPVPPCATDSFPGIWEVPIQAWECNSARWATPQSCNVKNASEALMLLADKYLKHLTSSNRAPLTIVIDAAWIADDGKFNATKTFLQLLSLFRDEAFVVSASQVIDWIKDPTPLSRINSFKPWQCSKPAPHVCGKSQAHTCLYDKDRHLVHSEGPTVVSRMTTCETCPGCYPGLDDPLGTSC